MTALIAAKAKAVVGLDKSPEMIGEAQAKYPNISFLVGDAGNFNLGQKFHAIFSNAALHWATDHKAVIECMYHHLRKNGRLVLEFGGRGNVAIIVGQLRKALQKRGYVQQSQLQQWYFPSIGEYAAALEAGGFRVLMAQHFDRPTELADEETGIKDWLSMFAMGFFKDVAADHIRQIQEEVQEKVRPKCLINGKWVADYKRIRILAMRP